MDHFLQRHKDCNHLRTYGAVSNLVRKRPPYLSDSCFSYVSVLCSGQYYSTVFGFCWYRFFTPVLFYLYVHPCFTSRTAPTSTIFHRVRWLQSSFFFYFPVRKHLCLMYGVCVCFLPSLVCVCFFFWPSRHVTVSAA